MPDNSTRDFRRVFFWERTADVSLQLVQNWFSACREVSFQHHFCPDPGTNLTELPLPSDSWERSFWFSSATEYQTVLGKCGVFVAPRKLEGIGMSFLEAMAAGMVVVGFPYPTLSEYVEGGINGLLLNENSRIQPEAVDWVRLGAGARKTVVAGFSAFEKQLALLSDLLGNFQRHWPGPEYHFGFFLCVLTKLGIDTWSMVNRISKKVQRLWQP